MSKMIILEPTTVADIIPIADNVSGAENMLTPEPKEVAFQSSQVGALWLRFDLGSVQMIDCVFLGFLNCPPGTTLEVLAGETQANLTNFYGPASVFAASSSASPLRRHQFIEFAAPVAARYVDIYIVRGASADMTFGIFATGLSLRTTHNREKGGGRPIIDTGAVEARVDGGFGTGHGAVKGGFRWTWGDLDDAEVDAIYHLGLRVGRRRPIIVVEDPDPSPGLNERIHYSLFDSFEPYERGDPTKHRWALSVTQWV